MRPRRHLHKIYVSFFGKIEERKKEVKDKYILIFCQPISKSFNIASCPRKICLRSSSSQDSTTQPSGLQSAGDFTGT